MELAYGTLKLNTDALNSHSMFIHTGNGDELTFEYADGDDCVLVICKDRDYAMAVPASDIYSIGTALMQWGSRMMKDAKE